MEEDSSKQPVTLDAVKMLIITANVGSLFEDPENTLTQWLSEFLKSVNQINPGLLAIHLQEIGGKNYEESMQHVNHFVKRLLAGKELESYDRGRVFLDEDFTVEAKFTALGAVYFVHESVSDVQVWNFQEKAWEVLEGKEVVSGSIESVPIKEKIKFPVHMFPDCRWSRKGFLRTRWWLYNVKFDLINIHLFHDASNLTALERSPSTYSEFRNRAFDYALNWFETDDIEKLPAFLFGDFNFRLDTYALVKNFGEMLNKELQRSKKNNELTRLTLKNAEEDILTVEKKLFQHHRHSDLFFNENGKDVLMYDTELKPFLSRVHEYEVGFPPTYPFSEDINDGVHYNYSRCPAWCDRILLTHAAKELIAQEFPYSKPVYHIIGHKTCMGDHKDGETILCLDSRILQPISYELQLPKPVYLSFHLKRDDVTIEHLNNNTKVKARRVVSINGEKIATSDLEEIDIHNYATFENEEEIRPELRDAFRRKGSLTFQAAAKEVMVTGKVVKKWRNKKRHHSSSESETEDDVDASDVHTEIIVNCPSTAGQSLTVPRGGDECMNGNHAADQPSVSPSQHAAQVSCTTSPPSKITSHGENHGSMTYLEDKTNQNVEHVTIDINEGVDHNGRRNECEPNKTARLQKRLSVLSADTGVVCPCRCAIL